MRVYLVDLGNLLPKNDKDYNAYLCYDYCHSFCDDNQFYALTREIAVSAADEWVGDSVHSDKLHPAYAVVSETEIDDSVLAEAEAQAVEEGRNADEGIDLIPVSSESYDPSDVIYAITRMDDVIVNLPMSKTRENEPDSFKL